MSDFRFFTRHIMSGSKQMAKFLEKKNFILNLPQSEKRKQYKCGNNFVTVKDIPSWSLIGKTVKKDTSVQHVLQESVYVPDKTLNDKIGIFRGNIAALEVDAIVNAANKSLLGGGGVDAVIHGAAGPFLLQECRTLNGCETGEAKITGGYNLPANYVIHTVGPIGENPPMLGSCYINSLQVAAKNNLRTIAFPCISTGVYGYPNKSAAEVVVQTVRTFLESNAKDFDLIIFCLFMDADKNAYYNLLPHFFPLP